MLIHSCDYINDIFQENVKKLSRDCVRRLQVVNRHALKLSGEKSKGETQHTNGLAIKRGKWSV